MFKGLLFLFGAAAGAAGATAWLLSEPSPGLPSGADQGPQDRIGALRERFRVAVEDGQRAGDEAERRLRHEFEAYRTHPDRPATS